MPKEIQGNGEAGQMKQQRRVEQAQRLRREGEAAERKD